MKSQPLFTHKNTSYQRLTVHLFNAEHKKDFVNTHTYYDVEDEKEAIRVIWDMHSLPSDNAHDMSRKIIKATYQGKPLLAFKPEDEHTRNGWVVKQN
jgi:hypothetical protein